MSDQYQFMMPVESSFSLAGTGTVFAGIIAKGEIKVNDPVRVIHPDGSSFPSVIRSIEAFRRRLDSAKAGDNIGLALEGVDRTQVSKGDMIVIP